MFHREMLHFSQTLQTATLKIVSKHIKKKIHSNLTLLQVIKHQNRYFSDNHTSTVFRRPNYESLPDGSRIISGTGIKILPDGTRINTSDYHKKPTSNPKWGIRPTAESSEDIALSNLFEENVSTSENCPFSSNEPTQNPKRYSDIVYDIEKDIRELEDQTINLEDINEKNINDQPSEGCFFKNNSEQVINTTGDNEIIYEDVYGNFNKKDVVFDIPDDFSYNEYEKNNIPTNMEETITSGGNVTMNQVNETEVNLVENDINNDENIDNFEDDKNSERELTDVVGIGKKTSEDLNSFGIMDVNDLLNLENNLELYEEIKNTMKRIENLLENAKTGKFKNNI